MESATVLIVEDEPSIADILRITLKFHGFAVHTAAPAVRPWPLHANTGPTWCCSTSCCPTARLGGLPHFAGGAYVSRRAGR